MTGHRILVLAYGHVADTLAALPGLRLLRAAYPASEIEVLCLESVAPLVRSSGCADQVLMWRDFTHKHGRAAKVEKAAVTMALAARLRARRYTTVLVFHRSFRLFRKLATLVGARYVAGVSAGDDGYTHPAAPPDAKLESSQEENLRVLAALGIEDDRLPTPLRIAEAERAYARGLLGQATGGRMRIGIHPGSDWSCQQWLGDRFAEVAERLGAATGAQIVITGSKNEIALQEEIAAGLTHEPIRCAGRTDLMQFAAVIEQLDLLVSVNSAGAALARALDTPLVVLLGPEDARLTGLRGDRRIRIVQPGGVMWSGSWCEFGRWGLLSGCESPMCRGISGLDRLQPEVVVNAALEVLGTTMKARTA